MTPEALRADEVAAGITATSRAFWPDPLFGFFARTPLQEHRLLPVFLGAVVRDALRHGEVTAVRHGDRIAGTASWLPPGAMPMRGARLAALTARTAGALVTARNRRTGLRLLDAVSKAHPDEPHWYLALLGVDPAFQGRGLGGELLRPALARCDETGVPAYLETQKFENLAFYERFGFRVTRELAVDDSPTIWLMWREPVAPEL